MLDCSVASNCVSKKHLASRKLTPILLQHFFAVTWFQLNQREHLTTLRFLRPAAKGFLSGSIRRCVAIATHYFITHWVVRHRSSTLHSSGKIKWDSACNKKLAVRFFDDNDISGNIAAVCRPKICSLFPCEAILSRAVCFRLGSYFRKSSVFFNDKSNIVYFHYISSLINLEFSGFC